MTDETRFSSVSINGDSRVSVLSINDIESQQLPSSVMFAIQNINKTDKDAETNCIIHTIWIIILLLCSPIIICDVYFAYTDETCVNEYPANLELNLKHYLFISALSTFININMYMLFIKYFVKTEYNENLFWVLSVGVFISLLALFSLIWNILGAVIFWGSIYATNHCSKQVSTYIFVSLIIKFVLTVNTYKAAKNSVNK
jgi:hypothetical protein